MGSQYKVLFTLGHGSFGTVKLASHLKTEALVAIKTVELNKKTARSVLAEIAMLETLQHPNIICLFQVLVTSRHVNFITEYIPGGNLFEIVKEDGPMQEEEAKKIFGQVVSAIKYCHSLDIIHQDIKPQNVLIDDMGNAKLIDFGLAIKYKSSEPDGVSCRSQTERVKVTHQRQTKYWQIKKWIQQEARASVCPSVCLSLPPLLSFSLFSVYLIKI